MKRLSYISLILLLTTLAAGIATAGIRRVGLNQTYTTLTAAYTAAVNDDTLLISPGVYSETITSTKRLHWIGAGYDEVTISGSLTLNAGSTGTRLEGVKIVAYSGTGVVQLSASLDLISISRCWIQDFLAGACNQHFSIKRIASPGGTLLIDQCIIAATHGGCSSSNISGGIHFDGDFVTIRNTLFICTGTPNSESVALDYAPQSLVMENCIFLSFFKILNISAAPSVVIKNCIAHDFATSGSWGTYNGSGADLSYNSSTTIAPPGTNGILLPSDPFVNYDESANYIYGSSNLHLAAGSPCIDAGDPAILDLNGSRSDMGIYGGPTPHVNGGAPNYPFTIDLQVPSSMTAGQQLPIQATGRIGAGY